MKQSHSPLQCRQSTCEDAPLHGSAWYCWCCPSPGGQPQQCWAQTWMEHVKVTHISWLTKKKCLHQDRNYSTKLYLEIKMLSEFTAFTLFFFYREYKVITALLPTCWPAGQTAGSDWGVQICFSSSASCGRSCERDPHLCYPHSCDSYGLRHQTKNIIRKVRSITSPSSP